MSDPDQQSTGDTSEFSLFDQNQDIKNQNQNPNVLPAIPESNSEDQSKVNNLDFLQQTSNPFDRHSKEPQSDKDKDKSNLGNNQQNVPKISEVQEEDQKDEVPIFTNNHHNDDLPIHSGNKTKDEVPGYDDLLNMLLYDDDDHHSPMPKKAKTKDPEERFSPFNNKSTNPFALHSNGSRQSYGNKFGSPSNPSGTGKERENSGNKPRNSSKNQRKSPDNKPKFDFGKDPFGSPSGNSFKSNQNSPGRMGNPQMNFSVNPLSRLSNKKPQPQKKEKLKDLRGLDASDFGLDEVSLKRDRMGMRCQMVADDMIQIDLKIGNTSTRSDFRDLLMDNGATVFDASKEIYRCSFSDYTSIINTIENDNDYKYAGVKIFKIYPKVLEYLNHREYTKLEFDVEEDRDLEERAKNARKGKKKKKDNDSSLSQDDAMDILKFDAYFGQKQKKNDKDTKEVVPKVVTHVNLDYSDDNLTEDPIEKFPKKFSDVLYDFQKDGIRFAYRNHGRVLIADDMGKFINY
ncbi:MAG: hypothetical protein MJ252_14320 [archaeon]|nr:hypothetical protein [archaeon]